jgi:hypothetical protein
MRHCFTLYLATAFILLIAAGALAQKPAPASASTPADYSKSLHVTNQGLVYAYDHGLRKLTGLPADRIGCAKDACHARTCGVCHDVDAAGSVVSPVSRAKTEKACEPCHGAPDPKDVDVHVRRGMTCLDCHTAREIHGDGKAYDSAWQEGAMQTRCENCHKDVSKSRSHTVHQGKVDCSACHTREMRACFNCHIDSRLAGVSDASIRHDGPVYLANHGGRVKLANVLTYVYKNGTALTVGPAFGHKIVKEGRTCAECHGTANVKAVAGGSFVLSRFERGELTTATGIVPVSNPAAWKIAFLTKDGAKWVPLANAKAPIVAFSGFSSPLTKDQLARLAAERK